MNKSYLVLFILLSITSGIDGQTNSAKSWLGDLDFIVEKFNSLHPNPLYRLSAEDFSHNKQHAEGLIKSANSDIERYIAIRAFIASVQDGHTGIGFSGIVNLRSPRFPFRIAKFSDGYFIVGISKDYRHYFGYEVKSINGKSLGDIYTSLSRITIADNDFGRLARIPQNLSYAPLLKALKIIDSEKYLDLELINDQGQIINTRINSVAKMNFGNYANLKQSLNNIPLYLRNEDQYYWFTHLKEMRSIYFQFNSVSNQGTESFQQFGDRLWKYIDDHQADIDKVIIDIRNNEGGSGRLLMPFINNVIKRDCMDKSRQLFVLTGNRTYSAAVVFITELLQHCNVMYLGEPPGSPSNLFSNSNYVGKLPYSGFWMWMSSRQIENAWSAEREYFSPDIPTPFSSKTFFSGADPALEQVFYGDNRRVEEIALEDGIDNALMIYKQRSEQSGTIRWLKESARIENSVNLAAYGYLKSNKVEQAYTLFKLNTKLFPHSYNVWDSFAEINMVQDDFEAAMKLYHNALAVLDEQDNRRLIIETNVNDVGYSYLHKKESEKAIRIFKLNSELFPESAEVFASLGEAYSSSGNRPAALIYFNRTLELDPNNQDAIEFINRNSEQ